MTLSVFLTGMVPPTLWEVEESVNGCVKDLTAHKPLGEKCRSLIAKATLLPVPSKISVHPVLVGGSRRSLVAIGSGWTLLANITVRLRIPVWHS